MVPNKLESIDKPVALHYQELIDQSNAKFPKIVTEKQVLQKYQEMKEQMKYLDEEEKRFRAYEKLLNCPREVIFYLFPYNTVEYHLKFFRQ